MAKPSYQEEAENRLRAQAEERQKDKRVDDVRNAVAIARAWGDIAGRDALHYGQPAVATVETVIASWKIVWSMCQPKEKDD